MKSYRHLIILCLFALLFTTSAMAQCIISGTVRNRKTGSKISSVNVMLQSSNRRAMYGYVITGDDGSYRFEYKGNADSLAVIVSGFNIREKVRLITARSQQVDFAVEENELKIREVVVKAPAVVRKNDTLSYTVAKYADVTDHSIGDVLQKMPGMEVLESGEVKYNGKSINKFYIEDLDMLEGRYGLATKNIRARDIARVEVYENHQPIKALRGLSSTDAAALNLRLKDSSKGVWNGTLQLGGGYKPWMWNIEAAAMYFGRKFQMMNTYKTNNTGDDVASELDSFYGATDPMTNLLGIQTPSQPPLNERRYLDNNIHTVALNSIVKLRKELTLMANAHYIHDFRTALGHSTTTYYRPGDPLIIPEQIFARNRSDRTEFSLRLNSNTSSHYLYEKLSFSGAWDADFGRVLNDSDQVDQRFHRPNISLHNLFTDIRHWGRWTLQLNSNTDFSSQNSSLRIRPMPYPEIFDTPDGFSDARQGLDARRFHTLNTANASYTTGTLTSGHWTFSLNAGLNLQIERMNSDLAPMNDAGETTPTEDKFRNDIRWRKLDLMLGPNIRYAYKEQFSISLGLPLDFTHLHTDDDITHQKATTRDLFVKPSLFLEGRIGYNLKYSAHASYGEHLGGLYDSYSGCIMTGYRMISSKRGDLSRNRQQNYSASLSYGNALSALFGSLEAMWWQSRRNLMYGTTYEGSLSRIEAVHRPNTTDGYILNATLSKRIDPLATTVNLSGGFSQSWQQVLREDVVLPTSYYVASAGFGFKTHFTKAVRLDYKASYSRSQSRIKGQGSLNAIDCLSQTADLNLIIRKRFICRLGGEHYYNNAIGGADRNMFFLDAALTYKSKRTEYSLEATNLLDTRTFNSSSQSDITHYIHTYTLRPAAVLFKIKFNLQ